LTDQQWKRLEPLLPPERSGKKGHPYRPHREVLNGVLWIQRTGAPWRDLPERYPPFGTCHDRLTRWQRRGVWRQILEALLADADAQGEVDWARAAVDSTNVRAHQHAAGARKQGAKKGARSRWPGKRSDAAGAA
jgi:transposase